MMSFLLLPLSLSSVTMGTCAPSRVCQVQDPLTLDVITASSVSPRWTPMVRLRIPVVGSNDTTRTWTPTSRSCEVKSATNRAIGGKASAMA